MTRLNFPVINQMTTTLSDGTLDPNRSFDCVPECLAGCLEFYLQKHFEGGVLKELVYGRNYQGGTSAAAFVQLLAHYGVKLYPIDAVPSALVILAHGHIKAGHPVVITEPSPYVPGYTHVIVLDEEHSGGVMAMDPAVAHDVAFTDAGLADHMAVNEVWIAEKIEGGNDTVSISLTTPGVGAYFRAGAGNAWVCTKNDFVVHDGILNFYRTMGGSLAGLTTAGLPTSNEIPLHVAGHPEIVLQKYERLNLVYDPQKILSNPPGSGPVYVSFQNPEVDTTELTKEIADLHTKLAQIEILAKV